MKTIDIIMILSIALMCWLGWKILPVISRLFKKKEIKKVNAWDWEALEKKNDLEREANIKKWNSYHKQV